MSLKPDYAGYTIAELEESLRMVDGSKYPENKAALEAELEARKASGEYEREQAAAEEERKEKAVADKAFAEKARIFIAWYLVLSPIAILYYFNFQSTGMPIWLTATVVSIFVVYLAISHWAGRALLKDKSWAHPAAVAVLALQLLRLKTDALYLKLLSFLGIYLTLGEGGTIGFSFLIEPGISLSVGNDVPWEIGINIVAALMIYYLFAAGRKID